MGGANWQPGFGVQSWFKERTIYPYVRLFNGCNNIRFFCPLYSPQHHYFPHNEYGKHEESCRYACIERNGVLYEAKFKCHREHVYQKPLKPEHLETLMRWLNGEPITEKVRKPRKKHDDTDRPANRETPGIVEENPQSVEVRAGEKTIEPWKPAARVERSVEVRLQGLHQVSMRDGSAALSGTEHDTPVQAVRPESDVQGDGDSMGILSRVFSRQGEK